MAMREDGHAGTERQIIERQVTHLSRLVDDLLDVSRITKGKIQLQRECVDLRAVLGRAIELTLPVFERREHPMELSLPSAPAFVWADMVRLTQVFCNLLTNAAKFTPPEGRVALRAAVADGAIEVSVQDSGKGIPQALLPKVFDLFVQGAQPLDRNAGGLGLGLAIVKTLVQMHGGSVTATSEGEGRGSTFSVRLPLATPPAASETAALPASHVREPHGGRILIVDDNADAAETLGLMLEASGYEVRTAADGPAALAHLESFIPALAILDIGLPGMDGYELARHLRDDPRTAGIPLIALTGYGREPDRARALANDFQEHLVKPVRPDRLLDAVSQLLDPESRALSVK
jgi:CheY-like chemotaxis protein/anti-sigma regulatory factor (Ser/Thr protein kinase)